MTCREGLNKQVWPWPVWRSRSQGTDTERDDTRIECMSRLQIVDKLLVLLHSQQAGRRGSLEGQEQTLALLPALSKSNVFHLYENLMTHSCVPVL